MKSAMHGGVGGRAVRAWTLAFAIGALAMSNLGAQAPQPAPYQPLPPDQLDSLVAPIALYADPLLAQVMLAATYPQQIAAAAAWVRANGTGAVDVQPWDVSVKAVAHYPGVLNMLDSNLDWTTWLGAAYANQSTALMDAVQHMRAVAQANGNLVSTPQQQVISEDGDIAVVPAQPQLIYVPVYDPAAVYYDSCLDVFCTPFVGFSVGYPIGPWLIYDWNWPERRIFYTGWEGGGWIGRARPFVRLNGVYVNERFRAVPFNPAALTVRGAPRAMVTHIAVAGAARTGGGIAPFRSAGPAQRALVTRIPAPAARTGSTSEYRGGATWGAINGASRPQAPNYGVRQATAAPRQAPVVRPSYVVPRQAAPMQRQSAAPAAPRGGSSGGGARPAARGGGGRGR